MANSPPPRFVSRQLFSAPHVKIMKPQTGGGGGAGKAAIPAQARGGVGGLARGFGQSVESGDPTVTGDFERTAAHTNLFGVMGGDLTPRGKEQQTTNQRIQQYAQQINDRTSQGATFQEAFRSLVKSNPEALNDLMAHPSALQSMEHLTQVLQGSPQDTNVSISKAGDQVLKQDAEGNLRYEPIPGYQAPAEKQALVKTDQGYARIGQTGPATPVLGPNGGQVKPELSAAQMKAGTSPVRATTQGMTNELEQMGVVLGSIQQLKNNIGATGSLGWGSLNKFLAESSPLSGKEGQAYAGAYNRMAPALIALTRSPGLATRTLAHTLLDQLPDPSHAKPYNINEVLPGIENQMRDRLGQLVRNYSPQGDNRPGAYQNAVSLAKTYDAHPDMMQDLQQARQQLQKDPTQLTPDQMNLLKGEADKNNLNRSDWTRVQWQAWQRGMVNKSDFQKMLAGNSDLGNVPPPDVLQQNSPYRKQVPQDRTQAAQQAATLPPQPVTTQTPGQQPEPVSAAPGGPTQSLVPPQPDNSATPEQMMQNLRQNPLGNATQAPQEPTAGALAPSATAAPGAVPVTPAQQPLAQPAPGQSSGISPTAGGSQTLAPSASTPLPPLDPATLQLLRGAGVPTGAIEAQ